MGFRVGGSGGDSCSDKEGAGPVGSRVGGAGNFESSVREKENLCPLPLLAPPAEPAPGQLYPPEILLAAPRWAQSCSVTGAVVAVAVLAFAEGH